MDDLSRRSEHLTDAEWLADFARMGRKRGAYRALGSRHSALFLEGSGDVLVVGFDTIASARTGSLSGIPHAMLVAEIHGWSSLSLVAREVTFFRDAEIFDHFDALADEGIFDRYDRVIFYGIGPGAYAAAAFSVAAPGAVVVLVSPLATLDPGTVPWDDRYVALRRSDFSGRYGYAPDMVEAAERVILLHDPMEDLDAMHAALFRGPHVSKVRVRHGGSGLGRMLEETNVIADAIEAGARGTLSEPAIHRALRRRRDHLPYLRNLLNRLHVEERHALVALLCRHVCDRKNRAPRFRHHLQLAEEKLAAEGRTVPPRRPRMPASRLLPELKTV